MSADAVIGTAVLTEPERDPEWPAQLYICCRVGATGKVHGCGIPVYRAGEAKTLTEQWLIENVSATRLRVRPSLNWVGRFHNDGDWQVDYVKGDRDAHGSFRLQLKAVNPGVLLELA